MNFDDYTNPLPYPSKGEFRTKFWYRRGQCIAKKIGDQPTLFMMGFSSEDLDGAAVENDDDAIAFIAARNAYNQKSAMLHEQFKLDMFKDLGIEKNPKREKLFAVAWERGHSSGYSDVYNVACDLVELIED